MRNRLTVAMHKALFLALPDWVYLRFALVLFPIFDKKRRGLKSTVSRYGNSYVVHNGQGGLALQFGF